MANKPDKGQEGGSCNVTHCQRSHTAFCYNRVMDAWYCDRCAKEINRSSVATGLGEIVNIPENYLDLVMGAFDTE